ncbi:MAG: outer membrane protein assembly factor BamA [Gammaproteobacteria bacterium]|nr:outer membrane protein assembly factor BamA [Gammaproteobacteria bacterium]NNF59829.1 outer membrane protein assembly factor BamA [Gammaproteobacteria bacterium]NNM21297.1 outer membrane protein assembly factor BamA [Gammaproteobacteria bacterium]
MSTCLRSVVILVLVLAGMPAHSASEAFVVDDIRIEGLGRITEGTVFNYLPVNVGDQLDDQRISEALRAMYGTGFFDDIEFRRDGDTLVIAVAERPTIASFTIEGNKDIKSEDLETNLSGVGLKQGGSFDRSVLDNVKQVLTQEYFNRGKYGATIDTAVTEIDNNQVRIEIDITEGDRARIRQINVVGNTQFGDKELLRQFKMKTPNFQALWKKNDRYAREVLSGDLETLTSYYMDRGYADFAIESTQVAITPDKKDIYITINIDEGDKYTIADTAVSGDMVVPEEQLRQLILLQPGQTFSRKQLTGTTELMSFRLGQDGFSRATITPIPNIDEDAKSVSIDFRVEPGERVYVRRINFNGANSIDDEVLRREMRQLEGAPLSNTAVDRSEQRVRRLPFIEEVAVETVPVPGSPDEVDVEFDIEEGLPGQFGGGLGFSGTQGLLLNGNFTHTNFLGSGERVAANVSSGRFQTVYSLGHSDNYRTADGIGRNISLSYSDLTAFTAESSDFSIESLVASMEYSWPISEFGRVQFGGSYLDSQQITSLFSSQQNNQFVRNNGNPFVVSAVGDVCGESINDICGTEFKAFELFAGWVRDTRDRVIFPTKGTRHTFSLSTTIPGSEVEYYSARYNFTRLWRLFGDWSLGWNVELAYGEPLGTSTDLPPSKLFYAGGPETVRGFENSRLGPIDSRGNPNGGNLKTVSQLELLLPTPARLRTSTRFSLFWDVGNVFYTGANDIGFTDCLASLGYACAPRPVEYGFDANSLRQSVGVAAQWLAPLGTFRFSYAVPIRKFDGTSRLPGDQVERFQFSVGSTF